MLYGNAPAVVNPSRPLGDRFDEMMFWMYLPVSVKGDAAFVLPDNVQQFAPFLAAVREDRPTFFQGSYVYLTAKTLWCEGAYIGNRPGWHSDGFGTNDLNYIWCDRAPTDFLVLKQLRRLSEDCDLSMRQMEDMARFPLRYGSSITNYPDRTLLRLDPSVIHRSPVSFEPGMRTFVKVSLSADRYNLKGNAVNHGLAEQWPLVDRDLKRNHPSKG